MLAETQIETLLPTRHHLRTPSEPSPVPIKEPPNPPENPDIPVREPDPDDPAQIRLESVPTYFLFRGSCRLRMYSRLNPSPVLARRD
jgi:hypothetical protein